MLEVAQDPVTDLEILRRQVRDRLSALREECPRPEPPSLRSSLRELVVLASSSRGGSSMFAEVLRSARGLLHFRGEINPFFWLNGLVHPLSGTGSDCLEPGNLVAAEVLDSLDRDLAADCGRPSRRLATPAELDRFALDLAVRLTLQWPRLAFRWRAVRGWLGDALSRLERDHGWQPGIFGDTQRFHAVFLSRVRADVPEVNPYYYDLRPSLIRESSPDAAIPEGPPCDLIVEEPPFVTTCPWEPVTGADLGRLPLVVKTPSNAYRLEAIRAFFPTTRIRILHLARNAAAAINGLYDGWCYRGFFSHRIAEPLAIGGYTDRFPGWGDRWWKFDLPPGWRDHSRVRLEEVCAFQWRAAHESTLEFAARHPELPYHRLPFEQVIDGSRERRTTFERLLEWLGIEMEEGLFEVLHRGLPPIMATDQPRHRRWFRRAALLDPVLANERNLKTMERLGYECDPATWI